MPVNEIVVKTKRHLNSFLIVLICFTVSAPLASEDIEIGPVIIATGEYPPYYASWLPDYGPVSINIMLACKEANLECKIEFYYWGRVIGMLEKGDIDFTFSYAITEERLKKYVFSREGVVYSPIAVFFVKKKFPEGIHFSEYKDLSGYKMLGYKRSWYAPDFKKFDVKTEWMPSNADRWKMLNFGRGGSEAFLADIFHALYELRHLELPDKLKENIGFTERSNFAVSENYDRLMFSRSRFDKRRQLIRDKMDRAIRKT